ncbi:MAG: PEP-CTERM sorting domain-containing protein [Planctomycetota bacterium]
MNITTSLTAFCAASLITGTAAAVDVPFIETYSGGTFDVTTPVINGGATWSIVGDAYEVDLNSGGNAVTDSVFAIDNLPTGPGAVVTTSVDFTITGDSGDTTLVGFVLFGSETDTAVGTFYEVGILEPGGFDPPALSVNEVGGDDPAVIDTINFDAFEVDTFSLTVVSTVLAADQIEFEVTVAGNGLNETQTFIDTVDSTLGNVFGLTGDTFSGSSNAQITFDNFSVTAVPEPTTAALIGVGALVLIRHRRG